MSLRRWDTKSRRKMKTSVFGDHAHTWCISLSVLKLGEGQVCQLLRVNVRVFKFWPPCFIAAYNNELEGFYTAKMLKQSQSKHTWQFVFVCNDRKMSLIKCHPSWASFLDEAPTLWMLLLTSGASYSSTTAQYSDQIPLLPRHSLPSSFRFCARTERRLEIIKFAHHRPFQHTLQYSNRSHQL